MPVAYQLGVRWVQLIFLDRVPVTIHGLLILIGQLPRCEHSDYTVVAVSTFAEGVDFHNHPICLPIFSHQPCSLGLSRSGTRPSQFSILNVIDQKLRKLSLGSLLVPGPPMGHAPLVSRSCTSIGFDSCFWRMASPW